MYISKKSATKEKFARSTTRQGYDDDDDDAPHRGMDDVPFSHIR